MAYNAQPSLNLGKKMIKMTWGKVDRYSDKKGVCLDGFS